MIPLATLPYTLILAAGGVATLPVSWLLIRWGRRNVFVAGCVAGAVGAIIISFTADFLIFCLGCTLIGAYHATAFYYRYAAVDADSEHAERAVTLAVSGGLFGALAAPLAGQSQPLLVAGITLAVFSLVLAGTQIPPLASQPRVGWWPGGAGSARRTVAGAASFDPCIYPFAWRGILRRTRDPICFAHTKRRFLCVTLSRLSL